MVGLYNDSPRWDIIDKVYKELEELLSKHVNDDKLTFIELETIIKLMSLRLLSAEIKHLTLLMLNDIHKHDDMKRCYR
ncbi:MAG: hypothetical protein KatS3mg003_0987 [Candidatus Nitrosocaldaceae archaeon]|nr:MAG: hypothetical protein KatS3mg003_0987 [Candidatus Nitrosocaldaceae archaeon]